ncbi:MAG: hypothetical protein HY019_14985 [Aquabacterium sp.]|uniref:hypothetical protein n=1 Tax=Aquabacterium sp. TaxID=1872578 RepID=UPI0025BC687B|nr:hypothetical protein [Aquabacterium sp.]MBI3383308.1 hypothetical protein [Aquabacterium sp.]
MAAVDHVEDALAGLTRASHIQDLRAASRCAESGNPAVLSTPKGVPIIREWEYAEGPVLVFTKLLSCLGAIQLTGRNSLRGIHCSEFASGLMVDRVSFDRAMKFAGFDVDRPIYYFGGSLSEWKNGVKGLAEGLGNSRWMPMDVDAFPKLPNFKDQNSRGWVFETTGNDIGQITSEPLNYG